MRWMTSEVRANGPGLDLYLRERFAQDSLCPFEPGDQYLAAILPHEAIILVPIVATNPPDVAPDLPLTLTETDLALDQLQLDPDTNEVTLL